MIIISCRKKSSISQNIMLLACNISYRHQTNSTIHNTLWYITTSVKWAWIHRALTSTICDDSLCERCYCCSISSILMPYICLLLSTYELQFSVGEVLSAPTVQLNWAAYGLNHFSNVGWKFVFQFLSSCLDLALKFVHMSTNKPSIIA